MSERRRRAARRSRPGRLAFALGFTLVLALLVSPRSASAKVERFAVLIGNNAGLKSEVALRYAESDAQKVYDVLKDLGGFSPANMVLLKGEGVDTVRRTLTATAERVRRASAGAGTEVFLLVYYSGHADAVALHLGGSVLPFTELGQVVRGSPATLRLLVVDACRSGVLTRVKGGQAQAPFALHGADRLAGQGTAFLTSSAVNEDAQESDEIKGSFFTHGLVSGLLGAADADGDRAVTLDEAYRHAYDATLRASSRTVAGTQHPTFQFDLRGQGRVVMTSLPTKPGERAALSFPAGRSYLVLQGSASGPVVAEVGKDDVSRRLSLKAGRYFVRGRAKDFMLEGTVTLAAGDARELRDDQLSRLAYARLVRKGYGALDDVRVAHGPQAGYRVRTALPNADSPCHGFFAGYAFAFEALTLAPRLGGCRSGIENASLSATSDELDFELRATRAFDIGRLVIEMGVAGGAALLHQRFETRGIAPPRLTGAGVAGLAAGLAFHFDDRVYALGDLEGQTYFFRHAEGDEAALGAFFAVRAGVGFGMHL